MQGSRLRFFLVQRFLTTLQFRDYRYLWLSSLSASSAAWALIVARGWLVYDISGSSAWVGDTTFAAMIPLFIVPPVAGFLADKLERRRLLTYVFTIQLIHNAILAALALTSVIDPWHLVALAFVNGSARASQMPVTQALLPNLVPPKHLLNAIALNSATMHGSRLVGAGLVAPLLATVGAGPAFVLCSGFYVAALIFSRRIESTSTGEIRIDESPFESFTAGLRYVLRHRLVRALVVVVFLHCALTMSFESLLPVLSEEDLGAGDGGFSYLMMALGAGSLVGVLGLATLQNPSVRGRLLIVTGVVSGISPIGLALSNNLAPALVGAAVMGGSQAAFMAITAAFLQAIVPDAIRGRVMSVYLLSIGGVMASSNLITGALADSVGAPLLLIVSGLAFVVVIGLSMTDVTLRRLFTKGEVAGKA